MSVLTQASIPIGDASTAASSNTLCIPDTTYCSTSMGPTPTWRPRRGLRRRLYRVFDVPFPTFRSRLVRRLLRVADSTRPAPDAVLLDAGIACVRPNDVRRCDVVRPSHFLARLADWEDEDSHWRFQQAEREALLRLDVPHFTVDNSAGPARANDLLQGLDAGEISWQTEVIRQAWAAVAQQPSTDTTTPFASVEVESAPTPEGFLEEADAVADQILSGAVRRGSGAAWVGLGFLPGSDACRLEVLGPDLYSGSCGIALFLAAHARVRKSGRSADLALAAVSQLRRELTGRNANHQARVLGIGGATGLGSVLYAFAVMSKLLDDVDLMEDARAATALISDGADRSRPTTRRYPAAPADFLTLLSCTATPAGRTH